MCFYYLLLGHLLGDFVFQTNKIAENKVKAPGWNAFHAAIVTICMLIFSIPFGSVAMLLVIFGGAVHYFIDYYKPKIADMYPLPGLFYFLADQGIHILIIAFISVFADDAKNLPLDFIIVRFLLIAVFLSFFSAIFNQYILKTIFRIKSKRFFENFEKSIGILTRISMAGGFYLSLFSTLLFLLVILLVIFTLFICYRCSSWKQWMGYRYFSTKVLTDAMISFIGLILFLCS